LAPAPRMLLPAAPAPPLSTPLRTPTSNHSTAMQIHWLRRASGSRTRHWGGCSAASTSWSPWPTPPRLSSSSDDSVPRVAQAHGLAPRVHVQAHPRRLGRFDVAVDRGWRSSCSKRRDAGRVPAPNRAPARIYAVGARGRRRRRPAGLVTQLRRRGRRRRLPTPGSAPSGRQTCVPCSRVVRVSRSSAGGAASGGGAATTER
jgi:hypothetical protein